MLKEAALEYHNLLAEAPDKYAQDLEKIYGRLEADEICYQGEVIPILYQPLFFSQAELEEISQLVGRLSGILSKVIDRYLIDKEFRSYFGFSQELENLILADPGYSNPVPMARFDIFYYGDNKYRFCELNADGSSGMVKTNAVEKNFLQSEGIKDLTVRTGYDFDYCELLDKWIDTLLANYKEFNPEDNNPNIAIMDFDNFGMVSEFEYFKELLQNRGYQTVIVDPRELEYKNNNLYYGDFEVDLIYRRAVTTDVMEYYSEIGDLLTAYYNQDVCIVGSFRSQIIHNKIIFAILHDSEKTGFLNVEDRNFIEEYIPETSLIVKDYQQLNYIKNNREKLVLKPLDFYGAQGVYIGCDLTQSQWEEALDNIEPEQYLVQRFCPIPELEMAVLEKEELKFELFKYTLGIFMYNLSFAGIYTRAGKCNIIASSTGCVTLPNLLVDKN
ncbi:glutathionylspermidine synthase family protein [Sporohalobacter salinus]|uniref:glutathionylspermidine synthase family protein n=1 Tax=Sporohalobacter salinus TaxID=1494606 RepID=UPI00196213E3|nr:glutathionylspermidine synthase [Sporohalobacter salinus]